jgi:hypothetical protein
MVTITAPMILNLQLSTSSVFMGSYAPTIRVRLSMPATVRIVVQRATRARVANATRWTRIARRTAVVKPGLHVMKAILPRCRLARSGRYRIVLTARAADGKKMTKTELFTVKTTTRTTTRRGPNASGR